VTEENNDRGQTKKDGDDRTVTVSGKPLLVAGLVAFLSFRWIRRRLKRPGDPAP